MMTTEERKKCNRCKVKLILTEFKQKRDGTLMKQCMQCNIKKRENRKINKCPHGRIKSQCNEGDCNGSAFCIHGRMKANCNEGDCNGSNICIHGRQKSQCNEDECHGSEMCSHDIRKSHCKICSDPIKITIQNWLYATKSIDKNKNQFDIVNIIDKPFCKNLIEEYPQCYYCKIPLQYVKYQDDLSTIERLDNKLGHIKSNCVLACRKCNYSRIGNILNKLNESLV